MAQKEASVTVPFCIALPVLAVLILGLLEGARFFGLKADAQEWTNLAAESLFAGYQPVLSDEYGLFWVDGGFGTGSLHIRRAEDEMEVLLHENMSVKNGDMGINLFRMQADGVEVLKYRLAADGDGKVFEMQAANVMKKTLGWQAAKKILDQIENTEEQTAQGADPEEAITKAAEALKEASEQKDAKNTDDTLPKEEKDTGQPDAVDTSSMENPLEQVQALRKQGILGLVLPAGKNVSQKNISVDHCLLKRSRYKGNFRQSENPGWYERILMQEFIKPFIGNAVSPKEDGALSYGTEYLICGRESDEENLKKVVKKLLLLRETLNFLYLQQDTSKQSEAMALSAALTGILGNPVVTGGVKEGILAAWAYAESICDVKALLSGKKVPLMKNAADWNTQLSNLGEAVSGESGGAAHGMSYKDYLDVLLYQKTVKQIAYRSMDLIEQKLRNEERYSNCRIDAMIVGIKSEAKFIAETLFLGILEEDRIGGYEFSEQAVYVSE